MKVEINQSFSQLSCENKNSDRSCAINILWPGQSQCFHITFQKKRKHVTVRSLDKLATHTHTQARKYQHKILILN